MKANRFLTFLIILIFAVSCNRGSLPRADKAVCDRFSAAGDQLFTDVFAGPGNVLHSLMIIDEGKVVYESWDTGFAPELPHVMWSVSKTFTATAIGFAEQEGFLSTSDKVIDYFDADELPAEQHPWLTSMTLHDLLIMSSGLPDIVLDAIQGKVDNWAKATLAADFQFEPGTQFQYNSMDSYILSVILSRATGRKLNDYLEEKLFAPLKIKEHIWSESPQGYNAGGWGLYLTTESLAKVGQFFLQRGEWNGKQLLSEEWFDKATYPHIMQYQNVVTDPVELEGLRNCRDHWCQGYAYQMWNCNDGAVRMHGAGCQLCIIFPEQNAVVVTTAEISDEKRILDAIWNNIYPLL